MEMFNCYIITQSLDYTYTSVLLIGKIFFELHSMHMNICQNCLYTYWGDISKQFRILEGCQLVFVSEGKYCAIADLLVR